jgi:uncharacterized damage-inducible protein DinB
MTERSDIPATWDERGTLATMLDYTRATVHVKCAEASDEDARAAPLATSPLMTLKGLVNHLRWVEHSWFETRFLGEADRGPWTEDDPDREFRIAVDEPMADLLAEYERQCDQSREITEAHGLDERSAMTIDTGDTVSLRWIVLHMIEETARHNGHIDIIRETLDGTVGL